MPGELFQQLKIIRWQAQINYCSFNKITRHLIVIAAIFISNYPRELFATQFRSVCVKVDGV